MSGNDDSNYAPADDGVEPAVVLEDSEHWAKVPEALAFDHGLSDRAVRVYIALYRRGQKPTDCYPSNAYIADCIGGSPRSVPRPLLELLEKGWIRRFKRWNTQGMRAANGYEVVLSQTTARRYAGMFKRGAEPEPLRLGRLAATSAQDCADGSEESPSALNCADGSRNPARAARAELRGEREPVEREPGKESHARDERSVPDSGGDASVRARDSESRPASSRSSPSSARADVPTDEGNASASLFDPAGPPANAGAAPPDSAGPPRGGPSGAEDPDFARFWASGPGRGSRKRAYGAWRQARRKASVGEILASWELYVAEWSTWSKDERQFIPHASSWLGAEGWLTPVEARRRLSPVRREDPQVQSRREVDELREEFESGQLTPERLFPRQARLAREAAARRGLRTA